MKMTPVRREERALIDFSLFAETDFTATWLGLRNAICAYQEVYDKYKQNIIDRLEDFKSNLSPEVIVWLFAKREVQLLLNAWKVLNDLLLKLRIDAVALPDETFLNEDLVNAGLNYKSIYGDKTMTDGLGRYELLSDTSKKYTFIVPNEGPFWDPDYPEPEQFDPGMATGHESQYLFRSRVVVGPESVKTNYDMCWHTASDSLQYKWSYHPTSSYTKEWYYAYKADPSRDVYTVVYVSSSAYFNELKTLHGQMYLCVADYTYQEFWVGVGYYTTTPEEIMFVLKRDGEWTYDSGPGGKKWSSVECFYDQVYYASEFRACHQYGYYRYDLVEKKYIRLPRIHSVAELQTAMDTHGTVYVGRYVSMYEDVEIMNLMDFIYDVIDWRNVDIGKVKCRKCGTVGMVDNLTYAKKHCLTCPTCENTDAYTMEFPKKAYLDFIRPIFQYDPTFSWYDLYIRSKSVRNELDPKNMWRGRFGHGVPSCWTEEVDDLMYKRSLRKSGWDKSAYDLATKVIFYLERYDVNTKIIADEILTLFTEETQAKAMFQVGNIWACRHEIVRLLCTQLMKIHQKGILIK